MPDRQGNTFTVRDWLSDCRKAEAAAVQDKALVGPTLVAASCAPVVYTFSNGREFRDGLGPYGPWPDP